MRSFVTFILFIVFVGCNRTAKNDNAGADEQTAIVNNDSKISKPDYIGTLNLTIYLSETGLTVASDVVFLPHIYSLKQDDTYFCVESENYDVELAADTTINIIPVSLIDSTTNLLNQIKEIYRTDADVSSIVIYLDNPNMEIKQLVDSMLPTLGFTSIQEFQYVASEHRGVGSSGAGGSHTIYDMLSIDQFDQQ